MEYRNLHPWNVSYDEAKEIQRKLRAQLILKRGFSEIKLVAGSDVSFFKSEDRFFAAVVVLTYPNLDLVEEATAEGSVDFPYIPGLLSFREAPILLRAFERISHIPDVIIFDGQGIAHPRGFGLASHMGMILDVPSLGCAKSKLFGSYREPGHNPGDFSPLKYNDKVIGAALRTKLNTEPVFVSPGHKIDLKSSIEVVMATCRGYRIPEPTRQAHISVNKARAEARRPGQQLDLGL
ncbi:MAG: deoxyribonuclease V [bacterium]